MYHLSASNIKVVVVNLFSCNIIVTYICCNIKCNIFCNFCSLVNCCLVQHVYNIVDPYSKCGFSIVLYILIDVNIETLFLSRRKKPIFFPIFPHIYSKCSFSFKSLPTMKARFLIPLTFSIAHHLFQMNY